MTTLIIEIPEKAVKTIVDLVEKVGGRVISIDSSTTKPKMVKKQ